MKAGLEGGVDHEERIRGSYGTSMNGYEESDRESFFVIGVLNTNTCA